MIRRLLTAAYLLPGIVSRGWARQYEDARIILEQNGDLHYLNISARMQRILVRGGILTMGAMLIAIAVLFATSISLMLSRSKLERSHEEVYRALLSSASDVDGSEPLSMNDEQMVALAQTIRDRDMSIRRFVDTSMVAVSQENVSMKSQLESSGLTEKIVKIIQQNAANGGFSLEDDVKNNPLLRGKVADELSTNRGLREVLYALPSVMPVPNYSVTSDFGVRRHPISGQTHFHTGVDLQSQTGDEKVHPVKPGVVVLAQFHTQYGNTVVVRHTNGVESLYAHLANIDVKLGDKVTNESVLGNIGSTGSSSTGKHLHLEILIGAYRDTLSLMRTVGLKPEDLLQRLPLDLRFADDQGLSLPDWPMPLNLLAGLALAKGWSLHDKASLIQAAWGWRRAKFECEPTWTVSYLCDAYKLSPLVIKQLIEPLCLSALNTSMHEASATVFLRVLHDALLGCVGSSDLLVPRVDLGALLPNACLDWLTTHGARIHLGTRVPAEQIVALHHNASTLNATLLACPPWEAARLTADISPTWATQCAELPHTAIATVYLQCKDAEFKGLLRPMMALHSEAKSPAQFVFDKGLLSNQPRLLAVVVSACTTERNLVAEQVCAQVGKQLGLKELEILQTVVEKRATLACTPMLNRPEALVAEGLWACGDYIRGPYPSTLEGAVRSGQQVVAQISQASHRHRLH